jgi:PKD repeat protein
MTRWSAVCAVALAALGCNGESPSAASPTVAVSRTPEGTAVAGATAVAFTATVTDAGGGSINVSWDLGDGTAASGASVVHVYAREGVFSFSVTATDGRGGATTTGGSVTVGSLTGRWLLSEGGQRFYERGFDITQSATELGGRPFSVPDQGCLGDLHGRVTSPRTIRFDFEACDGNVVVIDGTAGSDLRAIPGTYTHPDGPPQPMVLTRP